MKVKVVLKERMEIAITGAEARLVNELVFVVRKSIAITYLLASRRCDNEAQAEALVTLLGRTPAHVFERGDSRLEYYIIHVDKANEFEVTDAEFDLVRRCSTTSAEKVSMIKFIRAQYGLGLKEAKDVCYAILAMPPRSEY